MNLTIYSQLINIININLRFVNVLIDVIGISVLFILMIELIFMIKPKKQEALFLLVLLLISFFHMVFNLLAKACDGKTDSFSKIAVPISYFLSYLFSFSRLTFFLFYLLFKINDGVKKKCLKGVSIILYIFSLLMLFVSIFTGFYYQINESNSYIRGPGILFVNILLLSFNFLALIISVAYRKQFKGKSFFAFLIYSTLPFVVQIINLFYQGIILSMIALTISSMAIFLILIRHLVSEVIENEKEREAIKTRIVMSQIQPHFMYNALNSIIALCDLDSQKAKKAISDFAYYIRFNLDSLSNEKMVFFSKELEHVRTYLKLEKMRFGSRLNIVENIEDDSFLIPALTVQPIVENAVKHGTCKKVGGGSVNIESFKDGDNAYIIVSDDGVGFDPYSISSDERSHIGLENVKKRLDIMCNGKLEVDSEKGKGTKVTITIPLNKQEKQNEK